MASWTTPGLATDLVVSAASSLTDAFQKIAKAYEQTNPGTSVVLNFAASDVLLQQIDNGAPTDVYASADQKSMDEAQARHVLLEGSRRNFASNQLVVIVPAGSPLKLASLADLQQPAITRIAYGDPASVPVGRYTKGGLEAAGLWPEVSAKGVLAANVRQALDYVARDEVDVGFVYATDAATAPGRVTVALRVPATTPVSYPIAIVKGTRHASDARAFESFVLSPRGQQLLAAAGFLKP